MNTTVHDPAGSTTAETSSNAGITAIDVSAEQLSADLATKDILGDVLHGQGRFREAESLLKDVLEQRKVALNQSDDHPDVLRTKNSLAGVLKSQHNFTEAEDLFRQILASDRRVLGDNDFNTLTSMTNLAEVLLLQGKNTEETRAFAHQTVTLSKEHAGPEHPETMILMDNLANLLAGQQQFDEAEQMSREALKLRQKVLRKEHPQIGTSMNNLAAILSRAGKYQEAEDMHRQALVLCQSEAEKFTSVSNLAGIMEKQGRYDESEDLFQQAAKLSADALGHDDGRSRSCRRDLAGILTKQGKYAEAEEVLLELQLPVETSA